MAKQNEIEIYSNDGQTLVVPDWTAQVKPSFDELCAAIGATHDAAQGAAVKAINRMQTMRNWLIGYYIVEFEQKGKERAEYGTHLLDEIAKRVNRKGIEKTMLKTSRNFYKTYPQMAQNLQLQKSSTLSHQLNDTEKSSTLSHQLETSGVVLIGHLSFSHIRELLTINDSLERYFYEQECIRCNLSQHISCNYQIRSN